MALNTIRLLQINGYANRINDIIYCKPVTVEQNDSVVVFFGGDVQDFVENMESHRDNKNYTKWNLETTAEKLSTKFSKSHIVVVKPARMELKTFSCYDNFVPCSKCGAPNHVSYNYALLHLKNLLENVFNSLKIPNIDTKLTLIGFSKGCVVLNQFLYEFQHIKSSDDELKSFISKIESMYWLDGGHSGGKNTWITSRTVLECLKCLNINIFVHVTPYQIEDDRRPWIRNEERIFTETLKRLGANLFRQVHFDDLEANLFTHFQLLDVFVE